MQPCAPSGQGRAGIRHPSAVLPGKDPKTSVVNLNFESHDVDNLFVCDASVQPRAASGDAVGPLAVISVLASQRIAANHFKR